MLEKLCSDDSAEQPAFMICCGCGAGYVDAAGCWPMCSNASQGGEETAEEWHRELLLQDAGRCAVTQVSVVKRQPRSCDESYCCRMLANVRGTKSVW